MNIALFLGAGASVPYGKPATAELNNILSSQINQPNDFLPHFPDIEHTLTAIQDIVKFGETEGGSWFSQRRDNFIEEFKIIEKTIHDQIYQIYSWEHNHDEKASIILSLIFDYIRKQGSEITVFTTNYDRSVEEYCNQPERKLRCIDGFSPEYGQYVWTGYNTNLNENDGTPNVFLYKLHGSLDWAVHKHRGSVNTHVEQIYTNIPNYDKNLLIYPTLLKNYAEHDELFTIIHNEFSQKLHLQSICIVVGFSFRDERIKKQFIEFIKSGKILIVVDPNKDIDFQNMLLKGLPDNNQEQLKHNIHHIPEALGTDTIDSILNQINDLVVDFIENY